MNSAQVNPFEYVSILISIILGLGITQLLSAFSELLYKLKRVKFYWPHSCWVVFVLFLHVQDWFITYKVKGWPVWLLPELLLLLTYPIALFLVAKMLLPTNDQEEQWDMRAFYYSQYRTIFFIMVLSILSSIAFNMYFLKGSWLEQTPLLVFLAALLGMLLGRPKSDALHKALALALVLGGIASVIVAKDDWVVR
ncbi:MAG: hypothetical protein IT258_14030 [Saprospiraceae bacterium]|nr:hypothetical protein [Saprospiraceae bacterium]